MGKLAALAGIAFLLAGCGGSSLAQRCHNDAVKWAKGYVADLPGPVSQQTFDQLVQSTERVCMTPAPGAGQ